jgi:hypothetical protein
MSQGGHSDWTASYWLACRFASLQIGAARFKSLPELYWLESKGLIP